MPQACADGSSAPGAAPRARSVRAASRCVPVRGPWCEGREAVRVQSPAFPGFPEEDGERAFRVGPHLQRRLGSAS